MSKRALITGITGQDGSYLTDLLLEKGYDVYGVIRRSSSFNTQRIDHCFDKIKLFHGDMIDSVSLHNIINQVKPNEIYHLAAQSHVAVSFELPEYTAQVDAIGTLRLLEAIRNIGLTYQCKIYNATTSELFGVVQEMPQKETTPFRPCSPYGVAKLYSFEIAKNYRSSYGMFICNGILFNHESIRRGDTFLTKKVINYVKNIRDYGYQKISLKLGNLNAKRDWGYAPEFVYGMWLMLQQDNPDDFILATCEQHSVREFCEVAFGEIGIKICWKDQSINYERGVNCKTGETLIEVDSKYFRPSEVDSLLGDYSKAKRILNWEPRIHFKDLIKLMLE